MATSAQPADLVRDLSGIQAGAVIVGNMFGVAIFLVPTEMLRATGSPVLVLLALLAAAIIATSGALTYAELAARRPAAAGEYVFLRDAYGPAVGFLCAWSQLSVGSAASIAAISSSLVRVLMGLPSLEWVGDTVFGSSVTWGQPLAIVVVAALTALNYVGVRRAARVQVVATALKMLLVLAVGAAAIAVDSGGSHNLLAVTNSGNTATVGFGSAIVAALWTYEGWSGTASLAGEIRDPSRKIPQVFIGAMLAVTILYVVVCGAVLYGLPAARVEVSANAGAELLGTAFGSIGLLVASAGMALSLLSCLASTIMAAARTPYAVARDGLFFARFGRAHRRFHTPDAALLFQAILASALVLFGGSYQQLFSLEVFSSFLVYLLSGVALFVFRSREPSAHLPFRVWGYPFTPAVFIVAAGCMVYVSVVDNLRDSLIGVAIILLGLPVYALFARRR